MKENEELKKEELTKDVEMEKAEEMEENHTEELGITKIEGFGQAVSNGNITRKRIQSTIEDPKILFNLEDHVDFKINDMVGKEILVKDVVVKSFEKDVPERINEFTGEIETVERSIVTILIDDSNTSYVTGSKMFAMRILQLMSMYSVDRLHSEGILMRITKTDHANGNKKLGFELV